MVHVTRGEWSTRNIYFNKATNTAIQWAYGQPYGFFHSLSYPTWSSDDGDGMFWTKNTGTFTRNWKDGNQEMLVLRWMMQVMIYDLANKFG